MNFYVFYFAFAGVYLGGWIHGHYGSKWIENWSSRRLRDELERREVEARDFRIRQ